MAQSKPASSAALTSLSSSDGANCSWDAWKPIRAIGTLSCRYRWQPKHATIVPPWSSQMTLVITDVGSRGGAVDAERISRSCLVAERNLVSDLPALVSGLE